MLGLCASTAVLGFSMVSIAVWGKGADGEGEAGFLALK
jgi:hypothetical protein